MNHKWWHFPWIRFEYAYDEASKEGDYNCVQTWKVCKKCGLYTLIWEQFETYDSNQRTDSRGEK